MATLCIVHHVRFFKISTQKNNNFGAFFFLSFSYNKIRNNNINNKIMWTSIFLSHLSSWTSSIADKNQKLTYAIRELLLSYTN